MIRLIAVAGFALSVATSVQAMTPAPIPQPEGMITQVAAACGSGRTRVGGVCVARTRARAVPATGCGRTPSRPLSFTEDCLESSRLRIINASHPHIHSAVAGSLLTPRLIFRDGSIASF